MSGPLNTRSRLTTPGQKAIRKMTPTFYQLLKPKQKVQLNRLQRVMREGSPKYHYDVPALAIGVDVAIDIERTFPRAKKYEPLDSALIINNGVSDISVTFNGPNGGLYLCPAGTIRRISREEIGGIWQLLVTAIAAILVDTVDIELWRAPEDADSLARMEL